MVNKKDIETVKNVDLMDMVIQSGARYRRGTDHIKINCPWHSERTPSCAIFPDHYFCFGCSESGDILDFVMHVEQIGFEEAVALIIKELNE